MSKELDLLHSKMLQEIQEKSKAISPTKLLKRDFVFVGQVGENGISENDGVSSNNDDGLRVMQWNLLAQGLCQTSDSFVLCPPAALDWNYRQYHIMEEILTYNADIYCLEELDHFFYVHEYLSKLGFAGLFCPKPNSPCLYEANNNGPDGCAVFWRENKCKLLRHDNVVLRDDLGEDTNQVVLVCRFQGLTGILKSKEFLCAATHLKSKRGYEQLRFEQGKYMEKVLCEKSQGIPLILCGDFNAEPEEKVVGEIMRKSQLGLTSVYTKLSPNGAEPPYTTWKVRGGKKGKGYEEVAHTIDYMFITKEFQCTQVLKLPTAEEIGPEFLPSFSYPSDHLSLVADLKLVPL